MLKLFKRELTRSLVKRPIRSLPFALAVAVFALPAVQYFGHLTWDEATTAVAVPMLLVYTFVRFFVRTRSAAEIQAIEIQARRSQVQAAQEFEGAGADPLQSDIALALMVLIAAIILGIIGLASASIYWALHLKFAASVFKFDRGVGYVAIGTAAYLGLRACLRWCAPLVLYHVSHLAQSFMEFPHISNQGSTKDNTDGALVHHVGR